MRTLIALIDRNVALSPTTSRMIEASAGARIAGALFLLVCGGVFLAFGLSHRGLDFATALGTCFLVYGVYALWWSRRISAREPAPPR